MKKMISLITILCLLCGLSVGAFAESLENPTIGRSMYNPLPFGEEFKLSNVKTVDGEWKTVTVKVSEAKVDNKGALSVNKAYPFFVEEDLKKLDLVKVKMTCTMEGYTGKDGLISKNMPLIIAGSTSLISGSISINSSDSNFPGAFNSVMKTYKVGKKEIVGIWSNKKISQLKPSNPVTVSGNVYLTIPKGQMNDSCIWLMYDTSDSEQSTDLILAINKNVTNSTVEGKVGDYTYGDEKNGILKSNFELKKSSVRTEKDTLSYYLGEDKSPYLTVDLSKINYDGDAILFEKIIEKMKAVAKKNDYQFIQHSKNACSIMGIDSELGCYTVIYYINRGSYCNSLIMTSPVREKPALDKLWENYKIANNVDTSTNTNIAQTTSTTKTESINNTYGSDKVGKFSVPITMSKFVEKGNETGALDPNLIQFTESAKNEWIVSMSLFSSKEETALEEYKTNTLNYFDVTTKMKNRKAFLEYNNMSLIVMNELSKQNEGWIQLLVKKDSTYYFFSTESYASNYKDAQLQAIKSYLVDKGFTEESVKMILADPVFQ